MGPDEIIDNAENKHTASHHDSVVHVILGNGQSRRPEAEEPDDDEVNARKDIVGNAQRARNVPRAPDELLAGCVGQGGKLTRVGHSEAASAAAVQEKTRCQEIGRVETGDGNGNDAVEGEAGAQVDQGQQAGNDGGDGDGPQRDSGASIDLEKRLLVSELFGIIN